MAAADPAAPAGRTTAQYRDIADKVRARTDTIGKTFGALATTGATAVGLAKIGDLFPVPGKFLWNGVLAVLAVAGFCTAVLAVLAVATRLSRASRALYIRSDLAGMVRDEEIDEDEQKQVRQLFHRAARLNGFDTLLSYEAYGRALRRVARWTLDDKERARRAALADEVSSDIELTLARGAVIVIRRRAAEAVTGFGAWCAYVAFLVGLIAFAVCTDKVQSARVDPATAKACADARTAGARGGEIQAPCDTKPAAAKTTPPPSNAERRIAIVEQTTAALKTCEAAVDDSRFADTACDQLRQSIRGMLDRRP